MDADTTELVSILVPKKHLSRIYGFISTLDSSPAAAGSSGSEGKADEAKAWTDDLIRRQFNESPEIIKRFQRLLASNPDEWFSTEKIAAQLDAKKGSKSIAGALGAYGRRTSNRYQMKGWPFQHRWNHTEGQQYYSMTPEVAEIIKSL